MPQVGMNDFVIKESEIHGNGCFSNHEFLKGDTITVPVLIFEKEDIPPSVWIYAFPWDKRNISLLLSPLAYCNSSDNPNFVISSINKTTKTKTFTVLRDIEFREEVLLKYGNFDAKG